MRRGRSEVFRRSLRGTDVATATIQQRGDRPSTCRVVLGNGGGLLLWLPPGAVIAAAAIYLLGVPLSLGLEARWPAAHGSAPVRRYVGLGAVVAVAVTVALVVSFPAPLVGSPLFALATRGGSRSSLRRYAAIAQA